MTLNSVDISENSFFSTWSSNKDIYMALEDMLFPISKDESFVLPNDIDWEVLLDRSRTERLMGDISFRIQEQIDRGNYNIPYLGADVGAGFSAVLAMSASNTLTKNKIDHPIYAVELDEQSYCLMNYFIDNMGFTGRIKPVFSDGLLWKPPVKLDWLSVEIFDSMGINEEGPYIIQRLREYINKSGLILPDRMEVWADIKDDFGVSLADSVCVFATDFYGLNSSIDSYSEITLKEPGQPSIVTLATNLFSGELQLYNTCTFCPIKDFDINEKGINYDESDIVTLYVGAGFSDPNVFVELY